VELNLPLDGIIHFAGCGAPNKGANWQAFFDAHIQGTNNICAVAEKHQIPLLLHISSFTVYGWETGYVDRRPEYGKVYTAGAPKEAAWYMAAKICGEQIVKQFAMSNPETVTVIVRLASWNCDFGGVSSALQNFLDAWGRALKARRGLTIMEAFSGEVKE